MAWKDVKISSKIYGILGLITFFLILLSLYVFWGISNIKDTSDYLMEDEQLLAELSHREIDHLIWINDLNKGILAGKDVANIEVDETKCKFGAILYSDRRAALEKKHPGLKRLLNDIEGPHTNMHHSATEVFDVLLPYNLQFDIALRNADIAKLKWMIGIDEAIMLSNSSAKVEEDPNLCNLGIWLNSSETNAALNKIIEFRAPAKELDRWHRKMHKTLTRINYYLERDAFDTARAIYVSDLKEEFFEFDQALSTMLTISEDRISRLDNANLIFAETAIKSADKVQTSLSQMQVIIKDSMSGVNSLNSLVTKLKQDVVVISFITVILGLIFGYFITSNIVKKIAGGIKFAEEISTGDLTAQILDDSKDELGMLSKSLVNFRDELKKIIGGVISSSGNITDAASQMSSSSQQLSQSTSEQASTTEEVSSSMEEMTANIQQNTDNSSQSQQIAQASLEALKVGSDRIFGAIDAMKQIADKISIINDIAFQTNILALNASVEAARAGEHGRGFSVVAEEVRTLAQSSKESAKEISEVVKNGLKLADESSVLLKDLLPQMEKTTILVKEISLASREQSSGVGQINDSLQSLNQVVQQNAASAEEMASSSEELAAQAIQLKDLMRFFKLDLDSSLASQSKVFSTINKKPVIVKQNFQNPVSDKPNSVNIKLGNDKLDSEFEKF